MTGPMCSGLVHLSLPAQTGSGADSRSRVSGFEPGSASPSLHDGGKVTHLLCS